MRRYDAVLVSGGGLRPDGALPHYVRNRLEAAQALAGEAPIVPLSARTVHRAPPLDAAGHPVLESVAAAEALLARGVPPPRIWAETASLDTIGNAYFARVILTDPAGLRRRLVVNSEFHMPRTRLIFDWVFGLPPADPPYALEHHAVPDRGLTGAGGAAREGGREDGGPAPHHSSHNQPRCVAPVALHRAPGLCRGGRSPERPALGRGAGHLASRSAGDGRSQGRLAGAERADPLERLPGDRRPRHLEHLPFPAASIGYPPGRRKRGRRLAAVCGPIVSPTGLRSRGTSAGRARPSHPIRARPAAPRGGSARTGGSRPCWAPPDRSARRGPPSPRAPPPGDRRTPWRRRPARGLPRARRTHARRGERERGFRAGRRGRVEGVHGEAETRHGLARPVRRGLADMQVQASLTAAAIGPRRLGAALVALLAATPLVGAARPSLRR